MSSPTLQLACALMQKPSVTPADAGCQDLMMSRLTALGFHCTPLRFGDVDNFWAEWGSEGPLFAFAGHTDVVPTGPLDQWHSPPFEPVVKDGILYGRGAADMKGSLAAMITACETFLAKTPKPSGRIGFLITSDEEGPATCGTVKVVEWLETQHKKITWCLVGEPSSTDRLGDIIKNGRRGSLGGRLRLLGKQGHIAYPHLADNPIHRLAPALVELTTTEWDQGNAHFPATRFQVSNIRGGTGATNVIPGEVELLFNFRFSTEVTDTELRQQTEAILHRHGLRFELEWTLSGQPFLTAAGSLVEAACAAIETEMGYSATLSTSGGTSDGRFIAPTGAQVLELGPINASIHQINEQVSAADLDHLSRIYADILQRLLGKAA